VDIVSGNPIEEDRTRRPNALERMAYFVPWTLFLPIACLILGYSTLSVSMAVAYTRGILPPVIVYRFFKGRRRSIAYLIHSGWFVFATVLGLWRYEAGYQSGTMVTPHDIITIRFGLKWSSIGGGNVASTWLLASAIIAIAYFFEKRQKEQWRRAQPFYGGDPRSQATESGGTRRSVTYAPPSKTTCDQCQQSFPSSLYLEKCPDGRYLCERCRTERVNSAYAP